MPTLLKATTTYYDRKMKRDVVEGEELTAANDRAKGLVRAGVAAIIKEVTNEQ